MMEKNRTESIDDLIVVENNNIKKAKFSHAMLLGFLTGIVIALYFVEL